MAQTRTKRQLATAGGTFAIALSIGFVMQYGDAVAGRWGADAPVTGPESRLDPETVAIPVAASVAVPTTLAMPSASLPRFEKVVYSNDLSDVDAPLMSVPAADDAAPQATLMPAPVETPMMSSPIEVAATDIVATDAMEAPTLAPMPELLTTPACESVMTATPSDLAMVDLSLSDACRPNAVVAIHHQGMMFNAITDAEGNLNLKVPALAEEAFFIAAFDDGEGAVAITGVPSLMMYDRAVLQWQGEDDVQLHALEYGATYGDAGHVWAASAADPKQAVAGLGGFLTSLGDPAAPDALMVEVYTFPTGLALRDGAIEISVEAEVTTRNCGRLVEAQSIQLMKGAEVNATDLSMTMPGCDAVGEYLVLKNMFQDLTLASK